MNYEGKKYKYFLLDFDGTVANTGIGITKGVAYTLNYYGIDVTDLSTLTNFIGPPLGDSFQRYYNFSKEQSEEAIIKYREYYKPIGMYESELYDGIIDLLEIVKKQGGKIVLATSKPELTARTLLSHFKADSYFELITGASEDLSLHKKGDVIRYAMNKINIPKEQAIMIGDREQDIFGAKENDLPSIGVLYGFGDRVELENAGADYIVKDTKELKELMLAMCETKDN
jgi:phosphoglycolate phosphatase